MHIITLLWELRNEIELTDLMLLKVRWAVLHFCISVFMTVIAMQILSYIMARRIYIRYYDDASFVIYENAWFIVLARSLQ